MYVHAYWLNLALRTNSLASPSHFQVDARLQAIASAAGGWERYSLEVLQERSASGEGVVCLHVCMHVLVWACKGGRFSTQPLL